MKARTWGQWRIHLHVRFASNPGEVASPLGKAFATLPLAVRTLRGGNDRAVAYDAASLAHELEKHRTSRFGRFTHFTSAGRVFSSQTCDATLRTGTYWGTSRDSDDVDANRERYPCTLDATWRCDDSHPGIARTHLERFADAFAEDGAVVVGWAGLTYALPNPAMNTIREIKTELGRALLSNPLAHVTSYVALDTNATVGDATWWTLLGPRHLSRLGGRRQGAKRLRAFAPREVGNAHLTVAMGPTPPIHSDADAFARHVALASALGPLYPPAVSRHATWSDLHCRLDDGRNLTSELWAVRFADQDFVTHRAYTAARKSP